MQQLRPWLASISYSELQERYAFYLEEPWGFDLDNFRMGTIASVIANVAGAKAAPADFYPSSRRNVTQASAHTDPEHLLNMFTSFQQQ